MPKAPPRPCTAPRCKDMATKAGKCAAHYVKPKAWVSSEGRSAAERGYGYAWKKIRDRIMARDKHLCQPCLNGGRPTQAREVDHIIKKADGGTDDDDNLQAICKPCHKAKTLRERQGNK